MKKFAYTIAAMWTPHGHAITCTTKAADEAEVRNVIDLLHGPRAAAGAPIWEVDPRTKHPTEGAPK